MRRGGAHVSRGLSERINTELIGVHPPTYTHTHTHTGVSLRGSRADIKRREWCWTVKAGPFLLQVVTQQRCNGHCPCDSALAQQLKQQLRSTLAAAQRRGHRRNISIVTFWRRSHRLLGLPGWCTRSSLHSLAPPPPHPSCLSPY